MPVRYDDDPESGQAPIDGHNVAEYEVEAVPGRPIEDRPGEGQVSIAAGQTDGGRFEVRLDGALIFSNLESGRFPEYEEIRKHLVK